MAAERAAGASGSGTGPIHRLVRTLSGKASSQAQPISPVLSSGAIPPSVSEEGEITVAVPPPELSRPSAPSTRQKDMFYGVIDRFKNLSLPGLGKLTSSSTPDTVQEVRNDTTTTAHPTTAPSMPTEGQSAAEPFPTGPPSDTPDPAEPTYLARKIQSLIDALPLPSTPRAPAPPKKPQQPKRDSSGRPIPPPGATPIKDSTLIAMLSSATVMNGRKGTAEERERRVSVWSVLESMGSQRQDDGNDIEGGAGGDHGDGSGDGGSVYDDPSGIMMYSPLMPTMESLVEIADSGIIEPVLEDGGGPSEAQQVAGWMGMWPFSILGTSSAAPGPAGASVIATSTVTATATASTSANANATATATASQHPVSPIPGIAILPLSPPGSPRGTRIRIQGQRVWVPSTTKLSLQAMWWGYRLYLPPPVLDILDDKQIEASKRAALIATALTWFFSNIPLTSLPPTVRPALLLLQTLVPYVGYIGTFISWSWGTIKSYDTGHGVILTATWLLPVALIPGTWEEHDFPPASPPEQVPTPLPPTVEPPTSPPPCTPPPAPPSSPPGDSPPVSPPPPADPPTSPSPAPTPSQPEVPVQLPPLSPPQSPPTEPSDPTPPAQEEPTLPPSPPQSPLLRASEPLPPWVPPPPPPSPPKIPLPDIEAEVPASPIPVSPRFGFGVIGKGKSKEKGKNKNRDGERKKDKDKGRTKFKAMVSSPFSGSKNAP